MRTLTFKAQPTNAFFATVNQLDSSQLPTTVEFAVIKSLSTVQITKLLGSSRKLGEAAEHLIDGSEKPICRLSFEFYSWHVIERRSKKKQVLSLGYACTKLKYSRFLQPIFGKSICLVQNIFFQKSLSSFGVVAAK